MTTTMSSRFGLLMRPRQESTSAIPPIPPPPLDVVDNTIASTNYAQKCREIMDLYRDLRNLGYDIPHLHCPFLSSELLSP